ncbi:hypothetical protein EYV94_15855 [Puteibacter caeruleilacunae]|nr:hypothetical protein EYV94_15855 [Puteibacter caeruleilacunae]
MEIYNQIIKLRELQKKTEKGYLFEQLIREVHPWDFKPPIVYSAGSEQLDGVFTWKGITFIIESKAKEGEITQGSHDWEDFELKVRRRHGKGIIGIFCSLYPVHTNVFEAAKRLNQEGYYTIVLDGNFWNDVANNYIPLKDVFEFMLPYIRIKNVGQPPKIKTIKEWCIDKTKINKDITNKAYKATASFLRRHKHRYHDTVYVQRELDKQIHSVINNFKPSTLRIKYAIQHQDLPKQILVIRDVSGAGKTTCSVQLAHSENGFNSLVVTANDNVIDDTLIQFLDSLGGDKGISTLLEINKPLVYVVDSLDESKINFHQKRKEIISLLRFLDRINQEAQQRKLKLFPLTILFTVRDDYWRDWENLFEDMRVQKVRKQLANFNSKELQIALKNYSKAYNYNINNAISLETKAVLSQPINLQILSESKEYEGDVLITDIWEADILFSYFERKKEDVFKHPIMGFSSNSFLLLLSELAYFVIQKKLNQFKRIEFIAVIKKVLPLHESNAEDILLVLVSDQLLVKENDFSDTFRFKHSKFIEYLCSYYIANSVFINNTTSRLESYTSSIFDSGIVSMYNVHDTIRFICQKTFPDIFEKITDYYSTSDKYLGHKLSTLRSNIAVGEETMEDDLKLILKNTSSNSPEITWNSFFVLVAKNNKQASKVILDIFEITWKSNIKNKERWKMLPKISNHDLLTCDKVIVNVISSCNPLEWEKYLGLILETNKRVDFKLIQKEMSFAEKQKCFKNREDWSHVERLIDIIMNDKEFILGSE